MPNIHEEVSTAYGYVCTYRIADEPIVTRQEQRDAIRLYCQENEVNLPGFFEDLQRTQDEEDRVEQQAVRAVIEHGDGLIICGPAGEPFGLTPEPEEREEFTNLRERIMMPIRYAGKHFLVVDLMGNFRFCFCPITEEEDNPEFR